MCVALPRGALQGKPVEVLLTAQKRTDAEGAITGVFCFLHTASPELQQVGLPPVCRACAAQPVPGAPLASNARAPRVCSGGALLNLS